jgi:paraquat-inducible protein A
MDPTTDELTACTLCGQVQRLASPPQGHRLACMRCGTHLPTGDPRVSRGRTAALALTALLLYPTAITLPILGISRWGHAHSSGVLEGSLDLIAHGSVLVGMVVLVCSVVVPLLKLIGLLLISVDPPWLGHRVRLAIHHLIELAGRWGMLDVMLVAVLLAILKLGDMVQVSPGPGLIVFTICVGLSLAASACFDPRAAWSRP